MAREELGRRRVYSIFSGKIGKLGPVHTAGRPLIEGGCREIFFLARLAAAVHRNDVRFTSENGHR